MKNDAAPTHNAAALQQLNADMDALAERMAEHDEGFVRAGRAVGLGKIRAMHVYSKMRKRLGSQAV